MIFDFQDVFESLTSKTTTAHCLYINQWIYLSSILYHGSPLPLALKLNVIVGRNAELDS
jgi:hypothetical protein